MANTVETGASDNVRPDETTWAPMSPLSIHTEEEEKVAESLVELGGSPSVNANEMQVDPSVVGRSKRPTSPGGTDKNGRTKKAKRDADQPQFRVPRKIVPAEEKSVQKEIAIPEPRFAGMPIPIDYFLLDEINILYGEADKPEGFKDILFDWQKKGRGLVQRKDSKNLDKGFSLKTPGYDDDDPDNDAFCDHMLFETYVQCISQVYTLHANRDDKEALPHSRALIPPYMGYDFKATDANRLGFMVIAFLAVIYARQLFPAVKVVFLNGEERKHVVEKAREIVWKLIPDNSYHADEENGDVKRPRLLSIASTLYENDLNHITFEESVRVVHDAKEIVIVHEGTQTVGGSKLQVQIGNKMKDVAKYNIGDPSGYTGALSPSTRHTGPIDEPRRQDMQAVVAATDLTTPVVEYTAADGAPFIEDAYIVKEYMEAARVCWMKGNTQIVLPFFGMDKRENRHKLDVIAIGIITLAVEFKRRHLLDRLTKESKYRAALKSKKRKTPLKQPTFTPVPDVVFVCGDKDTLQKGYVMRNAIQKYVMGYVYNGNIINIVFKLDDNVEGEKDVTGFVTTAPPVKGMTANVRDFPRGVFDRPVVLKGITRTYATILNGITEWFNQRGHDDIFIVYIPLLGLGALGNASSVYSSALIMWSLIVQSELQSCPSNLEFVFYDGSSRRTPAFTAEIDKAYQGALKMKEKMQPASPEGVKVMFKTAKYGETNEVEYVGQKGEDWLFLYSPASEADEIVDTSTGKKGTIENISNILRGQYDAMFNEIFGLELGTKPFDANIPLLGHRMCQKYLRAHKENLSWVTISAKVAWELFFGYQKEGLISQDSACWLEPPQRDRPDWPRDVDGVEAAFDAYWGDHGEEWSEKDFDDAEEMRASCADLYKGFSIEDEDESGYVDDADVDQKEELPGMAGQGEETVVLPIPPAIPAGEGMVPEEEELPRLAGQGEDAEGLPTLLAPGEGMGVPGETPQEEVQVTFRISDDELTNDLVFDYDNREGTVISGLINDIVLQEGDDMNNVKEVIDAKYTQILDFLCSHVQKTTAFYASVPLFGLSALENMNLSEEDETNPVKISALIAWQVFLNTVAFDRVNSHSCFWLEPPEGSARETVMQDVSVTLRAYIDETAFDDDIADQIRANEEAADQRFANLPDRMETSDSGGDETDSDSDD